MITDSRTDTERERILLEQIERNPDINQATLADQLGVAVGTVNWHIKRLVTKGYVKVKRLQRRKLRYIITPEGIAFRARLTVNYIENSMRLYRSTRKRVRDLLTEVRLAGYEQVKIQGDGDIADICKLTCLEQGIKTLDEGTESHPSPPLPILEVHGMKVILNMEGTGDD